MDDTPSDEDGFTEESLMRYRIVAPRITLISIVGRILTKKQPTVHGEHAIPLERLLTIKSLFNNEWESSKAECAVFWCEFQTGVLNKNLTLKSLCDTLIRQLETKDELWTALRTMVRIVFCCSAADEELDRFLLVCDALGFSDKDIYRAIDDYEEEVTKSQEPAQPDTIASSNNGRVDTIASDHADIKATPIKLAVKQGSSTTPSDQFYFGMIWEPRVVKFRSIFQITLFASFIVLALLRMIVDFRVETAVALPLLIVLAFMLLFVISIVQQAVLAVANLFARVFGGRRYATFRVVLVYFLVPILFYLGTAGTLAFLLVQSWLQ